MNHLVNGVNKMEQFKCGHCGCETFSVWRKSEEEVITICHKCGVKTGLVIVSRITEEWHDKEERGVMCTGWS